MQNCCYRRLLNAEILIDQRPSIVRTVFYALLSSQFYFNEYDMMKHLSIFVLTAALLPFSTSAVNASDIAGKLLTGDKKYACEAIACLTSPGTPPKECNPALHRFYSIHHKYAQDTISARRRFLQQCPASRDKEIAPIIEIVVHR